MTAGTVGSVYYMSPEQINSTEAVDARSDLYSVGVSFYELVTGKHAFDGDSQFSIMAAHLEKMPVPPIALDPGLPQALNDLILISVAREPDRRFQTAEAFRNALKSVTEVPRPLPLVTAPAVVAQAAPPAVLQRQKSHRALWATVGALCFVAVLVSAIQFGPWKKAAADSLPPKPQVLPGQVLTVAPTTNPTPIPPTNPTLPAAGQPASVERSAAPDASAVRSPMPAMQRPVRSASPPFASPRTPNAVAAPPPAVALQAPVQAPVQPPVQPHATVPVPKQAPPQPDLNAQRAELQKVREALAMLSARAGSIHGTLENLQRSQAASGLGMRGDWLQSATLMDTFLRGSNDALAAGDLAAAKDFMEESERQIERLEKALNK